MIIAITGPPGSGKSYALVARAYKALKQGRPVYANFPIQGCYEFTLDDLVNCSFPEGAVIIVDEAGRWFNAQDWSKLPREVFDLFTMHRHLGYDMYVAVQAFNRIDKSLREVIELTYVSHKQWFWHLYRGFYEVERVGRIKGEEDVRYYLPKRKRYREMYNTFAMKSAWHGKPLITDRLYAPAPPLSLKESFVNSYLKLLQRFDKPKNIEYIEDYQHDTNTFLEEYEEKNKQEGPPPA